MRPITIFFQVSVLVTVLQQDPKEVGRRWTAVLPMGIHDPGNKVAPRAFGTKQKGELQWYSLLEPYGQTRFHGGNVDMKKILIS